MFPSQLHFDQNTRGLRDLTVVVGEGLEGSCKEVVELVRRAVTAASRSLHTDLQGKLKLDTVTVQVAKVQSSLKVRRLIQVVTLKGSFHCPKF